MGELELLNNVEKNADSEKKEDSDHIFCFDGATLAGGKRNGYSHDEQEGGEDQVCESEAIPLRMHQPPPASLHSLDMISKHHAQDSHSPVNVQRL